MARQRPPQAIRDAMAEVGMGSLKNFDAIVKASASSNADANRAFYPPLKEGRQIQPMKLMPSEKGLVDLYEDMRSSIARSPHAVRPAKEKKGSGVSSDLQALRKFYFANKKTGGNAPPSPPMQQESMWDLSRCWVVPELLPGELRPKSLRRDDGVVARPRKRRRIQEDDEEDMDAFESSILGNNFHADAEAEDGGRNEDNQEATDGRDKDGEDGDQNQTNEIADPAQLEEDEDLELGADYQTGTRFDDDDGYEENDSGAEEATF